MMTEDHLRIMLVASVRPNRGSVLFRSGGINRFHPGGPVDKSSPPINVNLINSLLLGQAVY